MNFKGKTALVTGASRGIGRAIAHQLAQQGCQRILLLARNRDRLCQVAAELHGWGAEGIVLAVDLADPIQVNVVIAQAWQQYGPVHLLVNCAGVAHQTPFLQANLPQVQAEISTNLVGLYTVTRLVGRRMAVRREGCIVNVSSLMGKVAAPTMATYSATKFAILGFTQALRSELAPYQVRVVALLPSLTDTDMVRGFDWFRWVQPVSPEQVAEALVTGLRQGRREILVGWQSHGAVWLQRIFPGLVEALVQQASPAVKATAPYPLGERASS
ncbi:MAG: SDR family NAD(P)-dependent oxidoreductase [Cyanobacteria bacterium REEB459]|nr:SDR family NAD(P)-dependent oxidoreductase [Cyanobacteria bacterium REEB459]